MRYFSFILLLISNSVLASDLKPCSYMNVNEPELVRENSCIDFVPWVKRINDSDALITKKVAVSAQYNKSNLAYLFCEYGVFYFNKSGKARKTISYDNGPDYFQSGLARTIWQGKIGFINESLEIVIKPIYDFAFPFRSGYSLVCNGCKKKSDGEHTSVVNGEWGAINKEGVIVVPVSNSKSEAESALNKVLHADPSKLSPLLQKAAKESPSHLAR